jgi:hypothetical protein
MLNIVITIAKHVKNYMSITLVQHLCQIVYNQCQVSMFTSDMLTI